MEEFIWIPIYVVAFLVVSVSAVAGARRRSIHQAEGEMSNLLATERMVAEVAELEGRVRSTIRGLDMRSENLSSALNLALRSVDDAITVNRESEELLRSQWSLISDFVGSHEEELESDYVHIVEFVAQVRERLGRLEEADSGLSQARRLLERGAADY